eukprot:Awhi_evm2s7689
MIDIDLLIGKRCIQALNSSVESDHSPLTKRSCSTCTRFACTLAKIECRCPACPAPATKIFSTGTPPLSPIPNNRKLSISFPSITESDTFLSSVDDDSISSADNLKSFTLSPNSVASSMSAVA